MSQRRNQPSDPTVGTNNIILSQAQFKELLATATRAGQHTDSNSNTVTKFALTPALVNIDSPIVFLSSDGNELKSRNRGSSTEI